MKSLRFPRLLFAALALATTSAVAQVNVTTNRYDNARTSQNLAEAILAPSNVNASSFGLLFRRAVDDQIYAQPLYVSNLTIGSVTRNVVFVATVNNTIYAFDADNASVTTPLWQRAFGNAANTDTMIAAGQLPTWCNDIRRKCGIMGTPVIDLASNTLYVVTKSLIAGAYSHHFRALDLLTGNDRSGSPVTITAASFDSLKQNQRPGLLLVGNVVYAAFGSHCDQGPYRAFLIGYHKTTLAQVTVVNLSPSTNGAIWQAGAGPAADASGNVYVMTGNGARNGTTQWGMSFVKLTPDANGALSLANASTDTFTPHDYQAMNNDDLDLGSSGPLLIPGTSLITGGGKTGELWLLNRSNLGNLQANDAGAVQRFTAIIPNGTLTDHVHGSPVYWNSPTHGPLIFIWGENDFGRAYKIVGGTFQTPSFMNTTMRSPVSGSGMPGNTLTVSSNGSTAGTGILWSNSNLSGNANGNTVPGALYAFNADTLAELWNSETTAGGANDSGNLSKYNYPTVANGKVYLATHGSTADDTGELIVYGLLGGGSQVAAPAFSPVGGTYTSAQSVTITTATSGATIRYTTDGSTPTSTTGTIYSAPVSISATTTLKAIAYKSGLTDSNVTTATYTIGSGVLYEAESLTLAASSGDVWRSSADANGSGGAIAFYDSTAAADYVTLTVNIPAASTYNIRVGYKTGGNRGTFQLAASSAVGGPYTDIGTPKDEYNASQLYGQIFDCGNATFAASGNHAFRFTITGKNAASSGYGISLDYIQLIDQGGGGGGTVAAPAFSPGGGTYTTAQSVTISTTTSGATIRYTTDGSTPTASSGTVYASPISIGATTTLKAIAYKSGMTDSSVTTATYTINTGGGTLHQAESLTVAANSAGDAVSTISDVNLSGGSGRLLAADAAADFITFTVPGVAASTYTVKIGVRRASNLGIFQLATAASTGGPYYDKGSPQDLYSASTTYGEISIPGVLFGSAGNKAFRFTVTGKNAASSDFDLVIDYIQLAP